MSDETSLFGAIELSIIFNYVINNLWTFSKTQKRGVGFFVGLIKFNITCSIGALINYSLALFLKNNLDASLLLGDLVGIGVATLWNYIMNKKWIWS